MNANLFDSLEPSPVRETSSGFGRYVNHAAATHKLLNWRCVRELFAGQALDENYVMINEENKGLLRIYGEGQGRDNYDGTLSGTSSCLAILTSSGDPGGNPSDASSDVLWGDCDLGYPNIVDGRFFNNEEDHLGGLTAQGTLKLDRATMTELQGSYLANIHILHPFLDKARLGHMVDKICSNYNSKGPNDQVLARRISTVIVLLVMALGKICLHEEPLPGFAGDTSKNTSWFKEYDFPTLSPSISVSPPPSTSEMRGISGNTRKSVSGLSNHRRVREGDRNMDMIPGLAYFARATGILGGLQGNDLPFMQANLLAALYMAQLACVIESWTWIHHACRVCGFLVRDPSLKRTKNKAVVDQIRCAYLTCLQLESDILAELDLQPTELEGMDPKNQISPPKDDIGTDSDLIMAYYSYQLYLRKLLNDWQKFLYPPLGGISIDFSMRDRDACEKTLLSFRNLIQKDHRMRWNDSDAPSSDINAARLRGKYYGARCIIHRPFLDYALHHLEEKELTPEVMERFHEYERNPRSFSLENQPGKYTSKEKRPQWLILQMLVSCRQCVRAAKLSTTAFDGVLKQKRLIVTNIFGTAHA